ncbi:unnamed protein product [marine sediment metagenome]|uniref:tRNA(adenine(34)) deaminase n=1 Tax=marine sediment metagenome TaxID=412755 RepID=X0WU95_9ZZZZ
MSQLHGPDAPQHVLDEMFMRQALKQADQAAVVGEVPVGAVIAYRNQTIARGYNQRESLRDPTAHAEMIAITAAAEFLNSWRLEGCALYVTLEPCLMCAGATVLARLDRLIYGAADPKAGACGSLYDVCNDTRLNHRVAVTAGVLAEQVSEQLQEFFQVLRQDGQSDDLAGGGNGDGSRAPLA